MWGITATPEPAVANMGTHLRTGHLDTPASLGPGTSIVVVDDFPPMHQPADDSDVPIEGDGITYELVKRTY